MSETQYVAIVNTPGYLPDSDDGPLLFDSVRAAWNYLADERIRHEDDMAEGDSPYSETVDTLGALGESAHWAFGVPTEWLIDMGLSADGTGTVYGGTPNGGDHDLGLAYSVEVAEIDSADADA